MAKSYFITGATGFVGINLLRTLLKENLNDKAILLIRKSGGISAEQRAKNLLSEIYTPEEYYRYKERIEVVEGNVTQKGFGLSDTEYHKLAQKTNIIFHSAATIKFNLPFDKATAINVQGTKNTLEFAQLCKSYNVLEKYNHISTAYVTGRKKKPGDLSKCRDFINTYEVTKAEAEMIVNKYIKGGLPATVFRPSIITGHSQTGEISKNSIVYLFLMLMSRGMLSKIPADKDSSLNFVPVNHFIDIMLIISRKKKSNGKTFNICNERNCNVKNMFTYVGERLGICSPEYIPIKYSNLVPPRILSHIETFIPYFQESHSFDLSETRKILKNDYFECDDVYTSLSNMIRYCLDNQLLVVKNNPKEILISN